MVQNNNLYNSFVIAFLNENFPDVLAQVNKNFESNVSDITKVLDMFCKHFNVNAQDIREERLSKYLNIRYKFIACVLSLYQPNKLIAKERLNIDIARELKVLTGLDSANLNRSITVVTNLLRYREFRQEVGYFCNVYRLNKK